MYVIATQPYTLSGFGDATLCCYFSAASPKPYSWGQIPQVTFAIAHSTRG